MSVVDKLRAFDGADGDVMRSEILPLEDMKTPLLRALHDRLGNADLVSRGMEVDLEKQTTGDIFGGKFQIFRDIVKRARSDAANFELIRRFVKVYRVL